MNEKKELRAACLGKRRALTSNQNAMLSERIQRRVLANAVWAEASVVALYWALPDEVQTSLLCQSALSSGKHVFLPRVLGVGRLGFYRYTKETQLVKSRLGVLEPPPEGPTLEETSADYLCVVPGLAFDRSGMRLGFGGGYYDRFLGARDVCTLGLCFTCQIVPCLPHEPWDRRVHMLCTEEELLWC